MKELEKRWCRTCMNDTQHEMLDSDKVMLGKKTKFLYKCVNCGERKNVCQNFEVWPSLHTNYINKNYNIQYNISFFC